MSVDVPVDADDLLDDAGDGSDVVRDHDDGHSFVQFAQGVVKLLFELVVNEIGGLIEDQQPGVGDNGSGEHGALHLAAGNFADGSSCDLFESRFDDELHGPAFVLARVGGPEPVSALESGEDDLEDRDWECAVEVRDLGHVSDETFAAAEEFGGEPDGTRVGDSSEDSLDQGGFTAAVGADDAEEIPFADLQIDVLQGFVAIVSDAYVAERDEIHGSVIKLVIWSMLSMTCSARGSISM